MKKNEEKERCFYTNVGTAPQMKYRKKKVEVYLLKQEIYKQTSQDS